MTKWLLTLVLLISVASISESKLRKVVELFRHGARASEYFVEDKVDLLKQEWKANSGSLTAVGIRQMFLLGAKIKNRYIIEKKFLLPSYTVSEILVYSTYYNRTYESAYSHIQGVYFENGPVLTKDQAESVSPPSILENILQIKKELGILAIAEGYQPIYIRVLNKDDHIINIELTCPQIANRWMDRYYDLPEYQELVKKILNHLTPKIKEISYLSEKYLQHPHNMYYFMDTLLTDLMEFELDPAYKKEFIDNNIFEDYWYMSYYKIWLVSENELKSRIAMSPLMRIIFEQFENRIRLDDKGDDNYDEKEPKMIMFSIHDINLVSLFLLHSLAFENKNFLISPHFATNAIIEFSRKEKASAPFSDKDYDIEFYINDNFILSIEYSLYKLKLHNWLIPEKEINNYCQFEGNKTDYIKVLFIGLFVLILGLVVFLCRRRQVMKRNNIKEGLIRRSDIA